MPKNPEKNLIFALDIGTSKIAVLVGEGGQDNQIEVIGFGTHPSRGLKRGVVVNIESTVQSIQRAVEEAELMAGCEIRSAYTGIAGSHIRSLNSHGIVAIRDREVNQSDVDRVIDAAKAVAIPADQKYSIFCRKNSSLITKKVFANLWECQASLGSESTYRYRRRECCSEYYQMCSPLRVASG